MTVKVYGISTCGTVKKAKKWLEARGVAYEWCDFRKTPPADSLVESWAGTFGAAKMRNTSGGAYRALGEEKKTWDEVRWTQAFQADAMLIKRPIIERDGKPVMVGFRGDDEQIAALLVD